MNRLASMQEEGHLQQRKKQDPGQLLFVTALDLLQGSSSSGSINQQENHATTAYNNLFNNAIPTAKSSLQNNSNNEKGVNNSEPAAILYLRLPFELKPDQVKAVEAWLANNCRGSIIYGSGTGKTEIAFECAKRAVAAKRNSNSRGEDSTTTYNDDAS